jgi:DNA-binding MarR family transcriptional regulator
LLERGLISAAREPGPRHRTRYRLEPSGEALVQELQDFRAFMRQGMEAGLDAPTRLALRRTLGSVMDNLDHMEAALQAPASEA